MLPNPEGSDLLAVIPNLGGKFRMVDRGDFDVSTLQLIPPAGMAEGIYEFHSGDSNLFASVRDIFSYRDWAVTDYGNDRCTVTVHLEGKRRIRGEGFDITLCEPALSIFHQPRGVSKNIAWTGGCFERSVTISLPLADLQQPSGAAPALAEAFLGLAATSGQRCVWRSFPLDESIREAAASIIAPPVTTPVYATYRLAKAAEILCLAYSYVSAQNGFAVEQPQRLAKNGEARIAMRVKSYIEEAFPNEISIKAIARLMQMSASNLCKAFRESESMSIAEYLRELKMRRGEAMLVQTDLPLKQIAHLLGYNHVSNFCTAYRRWCGRTPGDYRKDARAAVDLPAHS